MTLARGISPSPRAAHASTNVDSLQLVVYGGATGGMFSSQILILVPFEIMNSDFLRWLLGL